MFHDAEGNTLNEGAYRLQPGQTAVLEFAPGLSD